MLHVMNDMWSYYVFVCEKEIGETCLKTVIYFTIPFGAICRGEATQLTLNSPVVSLRSMWWMATSGTVVTGELCDT